VCAWEAAAGSAGENIRKHERRILIAKYEKNASHRNKARQAF
jgi:hypothetical protein